MQLNTVQRLNAVQQFLSAESRQCDYFAVESRRGRLDSGRSVEASLQLAALDDGLRRINLLHDLDHQHHPLSLMEGSKRGFTAICLTIRDRTTQFPSET